MKSYLRSLLACTAACTISLCASAERNPQAISTMLDRIGGTGTSSKIETELDETIAKNGKETFTISSTGEKPFIKGSSLSALTTGINWYLNHNANVNLAWNHLTTTVSNFPVPSTTETHTTTADYRYYLNYTTFSYTMSTWTWERWEQEIDFMALHGINMPLQIVGLDVVWRNMLMKDYGYTSEEANEFIAGPCFQAWWGMNNLEGWGGPNPDWWYDRQEQLAKKILSRMRELGIEPVLPGFAGMVPHNFTAKTGLSAITQGNWCGFTRPYILNPETDAFKQVAEKYYARLAELMGTSQYYSMDPFHEGANTSGISNIGNAYKAIYEAMDKAKPNSQWVIQQWQWSNQQYSVLDNVPIGRLIVLDLFSDGNPKLGAYRGHDVIYCSLANFGGRTGFFGRFNGVINGYFDQKSSISAIKGIGATPEAIEQVPVLYDMLFELPWLATKPDPRSWMADYTISRYGSKNDSAVRAWELLRNSALNCTSGLQGPHEAVMCARPAWVVNSVSSWGGSEIFYDANDVANAAYALLEANLTGENYSYDLTDISRQALTDYSNYLLKAINEARVEGDKDKFAERKATFLELMSDLDDLLATNSNFMVGRWTNMARGIADEVPGTTDDDKYWLELNNARTIISTWGERNNSEGGGLRDYSYRQWSGMLKDYYRSRWEKFFDGRSVDWYSHDHAWSINKKYVYDTTPTGSTSEKAKELLNRYLMRMDGHVAYRSMDNDLTKNCELVAYRGDKFVLPLESPDAAKYLVSAGTLSGTGGFQVPENAEVGNFDAVAVMDHTVIRFSLSVRDRITKPRTIKVAVDDPSRGSASVGDGNDQTITSSDPGVIVKATPAGGYKFSHWSVDGKKVSSDNPFTYYGASDVVLTANFIDSSVLMAGDVNLLYEVNGNGSVIITGVDSGEGHADLACVSTETNPIVGISEGVFTGFKGITKVTLPASCVALDGVLLNTSVIGSGQANLAIVPEQNIPRGTSWGLTLNVSNSGATYNQWGSGLLATGANALANTYDGGFQLYLNASGKVVVKVGSAENNGLSSVSVGAKFTLLAIYDAEAKVLNVTVTNASGVSQTTSISNCTLNDITRFATSIPSGVNLASVTLFPYNLSSRPFAECTALTDFEVETGNPMYSSDNGLLLTSNGKTLAAYPEGRLFCRTFRMISDDKALFANPTGDANGEITDQNRQVQASADALAEPTSLWRLTEESDYIKVEHLNSHRYFGGKAGNSDRVELPVSATEWHGEYNYSWSASGKECLLTLKIPVGGYYVGLDGSNVKLTTTTSSQLKIVDSSAIELKEDVNVVAMPVDVIAPEDAFLISGIDNDMLLTTAIAPGTVIPAEIGFMVIGKTTLVPANVATATSDVANYLTGTLLSRSGMTPGNFFTYDSTTRTFRRSTVGTVNANSAFISASAFGNPISAESLKVDVLEGGSALNDVAVSNSRDVKYYDINGRCANRGLLIGSDGSKTLIR